jgi:hypothetical protein
MKTKYPAGTTKEQWDRYNAEMAKHTAYMEANKPIRQKYADEFGEVDDDAYNAALNRWRLEGLMDAPNEPGYYRANND